MSERLDDLQAQQPDHVRGGRAKPPEPPGLDVAEPPMDRIDPVVRPGDITEPVEPAHTQD